MSELSTEELNELNELTKEKASVPQLQRLAVNREFKNSEGKKIEPQTWHIVGQEKYVDTVKIRPIKYLSKLIDTRQQADKTWKAVNETIYFDVGEEPVDAAGGVGCGRAIGKSTYSFTDDQKKANKAKAQFYGFLFGIAEIDGVKTTVSLRLTAGKSFGVSKVLQEINKLKRKLHTVELELVLTPTASGHPDLEVKFNPNVVLAADKDVLVAAKEIQAHIDASNEKVRASYFRVLGNKSSASDKSTAKQLYGKVEDQVEDDIDLDDDIPF